MDPLPQALAPPPNETAEDRRVRVREEEEARYRSSQIDAEIKAERNALRKKKPVKILVLGQSQGGKSTTIKNFQLKFAREAWLEERASWRIVIYLNLVRSVNMILDLVSDDMLDPTPMRDPQSPASPPGIVDYSDASSQDSGTHGLLRHRLGPLRQIQKDLEIILGSASSEPVDLSSTVAHTSVAPFWDHDYPSERLVPPEFCIISSCGWKSALDRVRRSSHSPGDEDRVKTSLKQASEAAEAIHSCRDDIKVLWEDPMVRHLLEKHNVVSEESPGFFLNDVDRIADPNYQPTDSDVLRARLRTIGVQQYKFVLNPDADRHREWIMYDVAGIRTSRAAWVPYFDDVDAIIFLAPISTVDEVLDEDKRVNRFDDTLLLWRAICSNKLLSNVQLILFMNKCDLLKQKLKKKRLQIKDHISDYGDRSNDIKSALNYFSKTFQNIMTAHRPEQIFFAHVTSVVDTKTTADTILQVKEKIVRDQLTKSGLV